MNTQQKEAQPTKVRRSGEPRSGVPTSGTRGPVEMSLRLGVRHYGPSDLKVVLPEDLPDTPNEELREAEVSARIEVPYGRRPLRLALTAERPPAWFGELRPGETLVRMKTPGYGGVGGSLWGALSKR